MKTWSLAFFGFIWVSACSSEEPGPKADDSLRTQGAFCDAWAKAACNEDAVTNCDSDLDTCLSRQAAYCLNLVPVGYTSVNAELCIDAVKDAYRDAKLTAEELKLVQRLQGECSQLVNGGLAQGETCSANIQCDTVRGFQCVIKPGNESGTCQVPEVVAGGDACSAPQIVCSEGYFCWNDNFCVSWSYTPSDTTDDIDCSDDDECEEDHTCAEGVCVPRCTTHDMCGTEGRCVIAEGETEGACAPRLANDEPCSSDDECASDFCLLTADPHECRSLVVLTAESSVCSSF
jgi:hypothetical protein